MTSISGKREIWEERRRGINCVAEAKVVNDIRPRATLAGPPNAPLTSVSKATFTQPRDTRYRVTRSNRFECPAFRDGARQPRGKLRKQGTVEGVANRVARTRSETSGSAHANVRTTRA